MPGIDYRQVRQRITMDQVLSLLDFQSKEQRGVQLRGPCPIPGCRSTSGRAFSVNVTRQIYHCFACHSHGNVLDLWAAVHHFPLHAAAVDLCRTLAITPPWLATSSCLPTPGTTPVAGIASQRNR